LAIDSGRSVCDPCLQVFNLLFIAVAVLGVRVIGPDILLKNGPFLKVSLLGLTDDLDGYIDLLHEGIR